MIQAIESCGRLISGCALPGERPDDGVAIGEVAALQVARSRYLLLFITRDFSSVAGGRAVGYQLRDSSPDGALLREGLLYPAEQDWDPLRIGQSLRRQVLGLALWGVPKGALLAGQAAAHGNRFVAMWGVQGLRPSGAAHVAAEVVPGTQAIKVCQFSLNDREDDLVIHSPPAALRQAGLGGGAFCGKSADGHMIRGLTLGSGCVLPHDDRCLQWLQVCVAEDKLLLLEHQWDAPSGQYQWRSCGALIAAPGMPLAEPSLSQAPGLWRIAARGPSRAVGVAWLEAANPLTGPWQLRFVPRPAVRACPLLACRCGDGELRLLTNDFEMSPHEEGRHRLLYRNPLYLVDIEEPSLSALRHRVVFDFRQAELPLRNECDPVVDSPRLLAHGGGSYQFVLYRVGPSTCDFPHLGRVVASKQEKEHLGWYYSRIHYQQSQKATWEFAAPAPAKG